MLFVVGFFLADSKETTKIKIMTKIIRETKIIMDYHWFHMYHSIQNILRPI